MMRRCVVIAACGLSLACGGGARYVDNSMPTRDACAGAPAECQPINGGGEYANGVGETLVGLAVVVGVAAVLQWRARR